MLLRQFVAAVFTIVTTYCRDGILLLLRQSVKTDFTIVKTNCFERIFSSYKIIIANYKLFFDEFKKICIKNLFVERIIYLRTDLLKKALKWESGGLLL